MLLKTYRTKKKSVDEIIDNLPKDEKVIVKRLRAIALECLPTAVEKNMYGAIFYTHQRMISFIWPPSLHWGVKNRTLLERGVTLGFCQGNLMSNEDGVLLKENRKQVYCMYFKSVKQIDETQVRSFLFEADLIDEGFRKKKK